ncbi:cell division inhibitor [Halobacteriales archaeon SW_5_70_135]|nr:MAG: cell division inhibitor [Halobacteriales archaeon SW_5_70_135]
MTDDASATTGTPGGTEAEAAGVVALVGAAGGAGTTRLTVETGALLARGGERVAVFDAAFDTQGMVDHVEGRVTADVVDLVTDDAVAPADAMVEQPTAGERALHLAPARAPFAGVARGKSADAARRFESTLRAAADRFDRVLVDTPPLGANQAVAAVTAADRTGVVAPATPRGVDALQRVRGRVEDVGATVDAAVGNSHATGAASEAAFDVVVPGHAETAPSAVPVVDEENGAFAEAIAAVARAVVGVDPDVELDAGGFLSRLQ